MDCSSFVSDEIICRACAEQCHEGHTIVPSPTKMCRCLHKTPMANSGGIESIENVTENVPLVVRHRNKEINQIANTGTGGHCFLCIHKTYDLTCLGFILSKLIINGHFRGINRKLSWILVPGGIS